MGEDVTISVASLELRDADGVLRPLDLLGHPGPFESVPTSEPASPQGCMTVCPTCGAKLETRTWVDDGRSRKVEVGMSDGGTQMVNAFTFVELYGCGAIHAYGVRDNGLVRGCLEAG